MNTTEVRDRFAQSKVARLATVDPGGNPHLVPITFALLDEHTIVTAVDHKPKRTTYLRRVRNIDANEAVAVLVDHYADDWDELWWARADGAATTVGPGEGRTLRTAAIKALAGRYPQYRDTRPTGILIVIAVERWSGWSAMPGA